MTEARLSPEYLQDYVIYQLPLRNFTPEGTFNAAAKLLPHVAEIGADIVCITPFATADDDDNKEFWSDSQKAAGIDNPNNPYRIKEFFSVDPEYGTEEDLAAFVSIAHQLGLSVMVDLVCLSCGPNAKLIQDDQDFVCRDQNGNLAKGKNGLPALNFQNPELQDFLIDHMAYLAQNFAIDGFRCTDAADVPLAFWDSAREALDDINPDLILLADGEEPDFTEDVFDISQSFRWADAVNQVFDKKADATLLQKVWQEQNQAFPIGTFLLRGFDSLDRANDSGTERPEKKWSQDANDAALLLNFTMDGIPFVYTGQEIADATPQTIFGNRNTAHNNCVNWSKLLTSEGQARLEFFKKLSEMRHETTTLNQGDLVWVSNDAPEKVVSFCRVPELYEEDVEDDGDETEEHHCHCHVHEDGEEHHCHCHDHEDGEEHHCHCHDHEDLEDEDFEDYDEEDDACDCGCEDEHHHESDVLVVVNTTDKPLATTVDITLERGTLLNVKMIKGATYKPSGDHLDVCLLPYGFLVLEF